MKKFVLWFRQHSLSTKIIAVMLAVIVCMEILTVFLLNVTVRDRLQAYTIQDNQRRLEQISAQLDNAFFHICEDMVQAYETISVQAHNQSNTFTQYTTFSILFAQCYSDMIRSMETYRYIHSVMLLPKDGPYYYNSTNYQRHFLEEDLFEKVRVDVPLTEPINWSEPLGEGYYFTTDSGARLISLVMPISSNYQTTALLVVNVEISQILDYLEDAAYGDFLLLTTNAGCQLYAQERYVSLDGRDRSAMEHGAIADLKQTGASVVLTQQLETNGWRMTMLYAKSKLQQSFESWISMILAQVLFLGIALAAVSAFLIREVTNPIKRLAGEIQESERTGKLKEISFRPKTHDEVGILIRAYNRLIVKTRSSMQRVEAEQKISKKAYLQALQMQINPHFLYNTMDALRYLVQMQAPEAMEMATAISEFYKRSLIGTEDLTCLEQEVLHIKYYLQIMKLRYKSKFDFEIQIEESLRQNVMIQLALQPIVENAIYHGVKEKRGKNYIRISTYREDDTMVVEVYDNGSGMPPTVLQEVRKRLYVDDAIPSGAHIGLSNVHQRIQLRFGKRYGLELNSVAQEFTVCRVILPLQQYQESGAPGEERRNV